MCIGSTWECQALPPHLFVVSFRGAPPVVHGRVWRLRELVVWPESSSCKRSQEPCITPLHQPSRIPRTNKRRNTNREARGCLQGKGEAVNAICEKPDVVFRKTGFLPVLSDRFPLFLQITNPKIVNVGMRKTGRSHKNLALPGCSSPAMNIGFSGLRRCYKIY